MKLSTGSFYFIRESFFEKYSDSNLMTNKCRESDSKNKRPCYYCFKDSIEPELYWFIPLSSNIDKFRQIYKQKMQRFNKCNTIMFAEINGIESVFLIQNMFPCIEKYIHDIYINKNTKKPVFAASSFEREIQRNAREVLKLHKSGVEIIFPNVLKIEKALLEELQKNN